MPEKGKGQGYVFFNKQRKKWNAQYMEYDVKTGISKPKTKSLKEDKKVRALTTHDIDLKNRRMNVHRTLTTDENYATIMGNTTKTYSGKRIFSLSLYC